MPLPEIVTGSLLDVRRRLGFKQTVDVLILLDQTGIELLRIDHFWYIEPPRIKFGKAYESCRLKIVEDEENIAPIPVVLDAYMEQVDSFQYEMIDELNVTTTGPLIRHYGIRKPQSGRHRVWQCELHVEAFGESFFVPPGQRM